jgi:HSP20 family protein
MIGNAFIGEQQLLFPRIDLFDAGDSLKVHVDMAGVPKENVAIDIVNGNLILQGQVSDDKSTSDMNCYKRERYCGKFYRSIPLPASVDMANIKAEYKNGLLDMTLKKTKESQPKRILIQ